jgi:iron(III) transport system substrate-binding protein
MPMPRTLRYIASALATSACAHALAQAPADRAQAAVREGEVVWYTAMNTSDGDALRKRFEEKHPGLRLTILRQPGEKIRNRILTEARAGRHFWDVVSFNHLDMDALDRERLLASYASPETATAYAPGAVDPRGRWAAIYVRQFVIGYNTSAVAPAEVPRTWEDLLQPRWKGKLAMDENEVEWYAGMCDYLGHEKCARYMRALAAQSPQLRRGHSLLSKLLAAGDFPLALVHAAEMEDGKRAGAPVDWVRTLDPVVTSPSQVAISAKAPHPNAARLLVDFVLSAEGQGIIASRGRVPARIGVASETPTPAHVHYVSPKLARDFDRHEREFGEIFLRAR